MAHAYLDVFKEAGYEGMLYSSKSYLEKIWLETDYPIWLAHYIPTGIPISLACVIFCINFESRTYSESLFLVVPTRINRLPYMACSLYEENKL